MIKGKADSHNQRKTMKYSLCLTYISLSSLFLFPCFAGPSLVRHSCRKAAKSDPEISYNFCVTSLRSNPKSNKANLEQLGLISIELAITNATYVSSKIKRILKSGNFDSFAKSCLRDCLELYTNAVPDLKAAVKDFKRKDYNGANSEISSALDASVTCEDGFKEKKGELRPLKKENKVFFQLNAIALAFTTMFG